MDLGAAKLRRSGSNYLQHALHRDHGMVWTDGKNIFQAPVHLYRDQVEKASSTRLGEFEQVLSVHWSSSSDQDACYMAAVHPKSVSVWQVTGAAPVLAFKQVRKIKVETLPQGCLWNSRLKDLICLLTRQQVSFFFHHSKERGTVSFPKLEHGRISCGCWSSDGNRLVVCVGTALLIYTWPNIETSVRDFVQAAWRIPGVSSSVNISCIIPANESRFVCAYNLPLEVLCQSKDNDTFLMPSSGQKMEDGMICAEGAMSVKASLLNLQTNTEIEQEAVSTLTLLQTSHDDKDPIVIASTKVPGLFTPDILHFQVESQCLVVGNGVQNTLYVFALLDNHLLPAGDIVLERNERVKGLSEPDSCLINSSYGVLVLVGTTEPADQTFPSKDNTSMYTLSLRFFPTRAEKGRTLANGHGASMSTVTLAKSESLREHSRPKSISDSHIHTRQASYKGERPDHRLRSPERTGMEESFRLSLARIDSGEIHPSLVEEMASESPRGHGLVMEVDGGGHSVQKTAHALEIERAEFSQHSPRFQNTNLTQKYELTPDGRTPHSRNGENSGNSRSSGDGQAIQNGSARRELNGAKNNQVSEDSVDLSSARRKSNQLSQGLEDSATKSHSPPAQSRSPLPVDRGNDNHHAARPRSNQLSSNEEPVLTKSLSLDMRRTSRDSDSSAVSSGTNNGTDRLEKPARTFRKSASMDRQPTIQVQDMSLQSPTSDPSPAGHSMGVPSVRISGLARNPNFDDGGSVCSSFTSSDSNYEALERQVHIQRETIDALQRKLEELCTMVEDTACVFPVRYQSMSEPEFVSIHCMVRQGARRLQRKFLLDNGRLQLDPIKQAFGLLTVELILDGEPLVLGSNIDGYIPMKFSSGAILQITGIPITALTALSPELAQKAFPKELGGETLEKLK